MHIDLLNPASFIGGHPHDQYDWLRENAPIYRHKDPGGADFWAVTRYEDVHYIGRHSEFFSSSPTIMIADPDPEAPSTMGDYKMMLMMVPPEHTAYRKLISREFTQGPVNQYEHRIKELAAQIVDAVIDKGECDFIDDIAGEMPSFVIADLMGLPLADGRELYRLTEVIHSDPSALPEGAAVEAITKMFEYGAGVIKDKRLNPGDDLASKLLAAEVDGRKLADEEFLLFFMLLIDAGGDTTRNLVGTGMYEMLQHPSALDDLQADPKGRIALAREELLRWTSPVIYMRRTVTKPVSLGGVDLTVGDKVVMYYGAANRDPERFENPHQLNLSREGERHIAFGGGHHVCLGQWFARLEIDAIFVEVLRRMRDFQVLEAPEWMPSNFISGITRLPIGFARK